MKTITQMLAVSLLTAVLAGVTGCQSTNAKPVITNPEQAVTLPLTTTKLQNYVWQLMTVTDTAGKPVSQGLFYNANKPLIVNFDKNGKVRLNNTCNKMWADYMLTNDNIVVGDFASTMMGCPPDLAKFDNLAPSVLHGQYKLTQTTAGEPVLTITNANQVSILKPVPKK